MIKFSRILLSLIFFFASISCKDSDILIGEKYTNTYSVAAYNSAETSTQPAYLVTMLSYLKVIAELLNEYKKNKEDFISAIGLFTSIATIYPDQAEARLAIIKIETKILFSIIMAQIQLIEEESKLNIAALREQIERLDMSAKFPSYDLFVTCIKIITSLNCILSSKDYENALLSIGDHVAKYIEPSDVSSAYEENNNPKNNSNEFLLNKTTGKEESEGESIWRRVLGKFMGSSFQLRK